jgi:hypothetical protein
MVLTATKPELLLQALPSFVQKSSFMGRHLENPLSQLEGIAILNDI